MQLLRVSHRDPWPLMTHRRVLQSRYTDTLIGESSVPGDGWGERGPNATVPPGRSTRTISCNVRIVSDTSSSDKCGDEVQAHLGAPLGAWSVIDDTTGG